MPFDDNSDEMGDFDHDLSDYEFDEVPTDYTWDSDSDLSDDESWYDSDVICTDHDSLDSHEWDNLDSEDPRDYE